MTTDAAAPDSFAAFMRGESALVFARWADDPHGQPYFLVDSTAADPEVKALAPRLECLMDECDDRRLSVVNRHGGVKERRDGFMHRPGSGNHSPESLFHTQAKLTLAAWVRGLGLDLTVRTEGWSPDCTRRADVMVTWADGRQVAFEVQHSALGINDWLERHNSYAQQGITDVWLFANIGTHFRRAPRREGDPETLSFAELHRTMARDGVPVHFINPVDGLVGTTYVRRDLHEEAFQVRPSEEDTEVFVAIEPLADCTLDPIHGLVTPMTRTLVEQAAPYRAAVQAAKESEARRLAARLARDRQPRSGDSSGWTGRDDGSRVRRVAADGKPIPDRGHCARCGTKLPHWQRGGACPEFACWPHEPDCFFARPDLPVRAAGDLLNPDFKPVGCSLCGGSAV